MRKCYETRSVGKSKEAPLKGRKKGLLKMKQMNKGAW